VDHAVRGLGGGKVPFGLGVRGIRLEDVGPSAAVELTLARREQLLDRPGLAFVEAQRGEQAVAAVGVAAGTRKEEPLSVGRFQPGGVGKRDE